MDESIFFFSHLTQCASSLGPGGARATTAIG